MRRVRKIKKTVVITLPKDNSSNQPSQITRGSVKKNVVKKVVSPAQMKGGKNKPVPYVTPKVFKKVSPIWKGQTVYLIGGGPSLKGFDWNRLRNKKSIAINKAIKFWPEADAMYWTDGRVWT